jgi:rfaE bifunctional protein nucleotidyltransferase chain/domain
MSVFSLSEAGVYVEQLRQQGLRVVLTNGVFDLLHLGHVDYLQRARDLGDCLIVGINSDDSARQLKGPGRPYVPARERAALLAALRCVDATVIFEELTADRLLQTVRPSVYVKGGDYSQKPLPEAAAARAAGAQIVLLPYLPDHSTSALITRIETDHPAA